MGKIGEVANQDSKTVPLEHPNLIGHVQKVKWYELEDGQIVTFHTALSYTDELLVHKQTFYADKNTWPSLVANAKGFHYHLLRIATNEEMDEFVKDNSVAIRKVIEI